MAWHRESIRRGLDWLAVPGRHPRIALTGEGTLVVVATYNESENISRLIAEILDNAPGCNVLVVDDSSPDGTSEMVWRITEGDGRVELLRRPGKLGLGSAYIAGFRHALAGGYQRVLTMDADFSHHPRYLPAILARAVDLNTDIVIGSRYVPGGGVEGWPLFRRVLSFGANTFARAMLGLRTHDNTGAYRSYSLRVVQDLAQDAVASHGYSALIEILWHCRQSGYTFAEVPITFVDRELGESKVSRSEILKGLTTVLRLRFRPPRRASVPAPD